MMHITQNMRGIGIGVLLLSGIAIAKDIRVDAAGKGDFKTIKAAIDSVPANNAERVRFLIAPGTYVEQITVPKEKPMISFIGQGKSPQETVLSYHLKATDPKPDGSGNVGTTGSSSTFIHGNDFIAENVTFENSAGDNVGQAVALKTTGDRLIFNKCRFTGFQDTLYPTVGRCYFKDCYITGDTDFIFGSATAVFDHCTINSSDNGYVTAANTAADREFGFVLLDCTLTSSGNAKPGMTALGRPWQWDRGPKAMVVYLRTKMGGHISKAGVEFLGADETQAATATRYAEFGSIDLDGKPLDVSGRVSWGKQLTADDAGKYTIEKVLSGSDHWEPGKALEH